ncbi:dihydrofolate reductase family protein [Corynebacterium sphenisci]|uniref:dihydrofolate reductase family protein n=1 Tax=Corynebacterium sphenisci TaxID=191493 RepID=UPI00095275AE|nr:dihydrofolate reductase family protein [Corynebacterium sphenisci]
MDWYGRIDGGGGDLAGFIGARAPGTVTAVGICSLDGRAALDGVSGALGDPADRALLAGLREGADAILVTAGTVAAEDYGPAAIPVAVVTGSLSPDPAARLFRPGPGQAAPLLLTTAPAAGDGAAPRWRRRRARLTAAGAEVLELPGTAPGQLIAALAARGLRRVLLEGGPSLYAAFLAADAVDELFLTIAPVTAGSGPSLLGAAESAPRRFTRTGLAASDSHVFLRYGRRRAG